MTSPRFSILQARAVSDQRVSDAQFRTLAALGTYSDEDGWCFPKLKTVGSLLGKSKQAVSRDLQRLCALGYIEIHKQYHPDGSRKNNLYRLLFDDKPTNNNPPRQRDVDTHQQQVEYPSTSDVDGVSTLSVDGVSTSEVDALTTHINVPFNAPNNNNNGGGFITVYENEIGFLTPLVADQLREWGDIYEEAWIIEAIQEAVKNNVRKASYIEAILKNWKAAGGRTGKPTRSNGYSTAGAQPSLPAPSPEEIRRRLREAESFA